MFRSASLLVFVFFACAAPERIRVEDLGEPGRIGDAQRAPAERERYVFASTWKGIPAGEATFDSRFVDGEIRTVANLVTTGLASVFYGLSLRFEAESGAVDLRSRRWKLVQEGEDESSIEVRFMPDRGRALSVIRDEGKVDKVNVAGAGLMEPIGAVFALRQTDLEPGRSFRMELFAERFVYRTDILVSGKEHVRVPGGEYDTILVCADLTPIVDGKPTGDPEPSRLWLTDDEQRIPVKVDMGTAIGRILLELREYESGTIPAATEGASR
jgi:hypothetical protein